MAGLWKSTPQVQQQVLQHILDTWEQGSMGRCPKSATAGHRGGWGTINRGVQSFMGAVRGVAQRVAARWTGNSGASARDMAVPLGRNHPPHEVLFQQGAQNGWMPAWMLRRTSRS